MQGASKIQAITRRWWKSLDGNVIWARARAIGPPASTQQAPADDGNHWTGVRFGVGFLLVSQQQEPNKHPQAMEIIGREFDFGVGFLGACSFSIKSILINNIFKKLTSTQEPDPQIELPSEDFHCRRVLVGFLLVAHQQEPDAESHSRPRISCICGCLLGSCWWVTNTLPSASVVPV